MWVRLWLRHCQVGKEPLHQRPDQLRPQAPTQVLRVGQKLIDAMAAGVGLLRPPAIAGAHGQVGLCTGHGPALVHGDVGRDLLFGQYPGQVAISGLLKCWLLILSASPLHDVRPLQPLVQHRNLGLDHEAEREVGLGAADT